MTIRIVVDSSANLAALPGADFASVALKIVNDEKEYTDDARLDVAAMTRELAAYPGRTGTSCPNVADWLEAFGDRERVFALTLTSNLSGAYNSALQAKHAYEEQHPGRKVCCLDSLSTGPEMVLIAEKLRDLTASGLSFEQTEAAIRTYMASTHLLFMLERVDNLAKNGRVNPLIAKAVGFLGIRIVAKASDDGVIQQLHKCRNQRRGLDALVAEMEAMGYSGGKVRIAHVANPDLGEKMAEQIKKQWPQAEIRIMATGGLCAFYAEEGGLLLGFEGE